jgi:hypothetical protein
LWLSPGPSDPSAGIADPSWITFPQLWNKPGVHLDVEFQDEKCLFTNIRAGPNSVPPAGLSELFKQGHIVTSIGSQTFPQNIYHYFELLVKVNFVLSRNLSWKEKHLIILSRTQGGDDLQAADSRRDLVYYSLVSPDSMQVVVDALQCVALLLAKKPNLVLKMYLLRYLRDKSSHLRKTQLKSLHTTSMSARTVFQRLVSSLFLDRKDD